MPYITNRITSCMTLMALLLLFSNGVCIAAPQETDETVLPAPFDLYSQEEAQILDPEPRTHGYLGAQLFSNENKLIVGGAHRIRTFEPDAEGNWQATHTIQAPKDALNPGTFGTNFSVDGDLLVARTIMPGTQHAVYRYQRTADGWKQLSSIEPESLPEECLLRHTLAVGGDLLVIDSDRGVEIFRFNKDTSTHDWEATLPPPYEIEHNRFGFNLATDGNRIAVSSFEGTKVPEAIDIYERSPDGTWNRTDHLEPESKQTEWFGRSMLFADDLFFVGAPHWNITTGCIYVYEQAADGSWVNSQQLKVFPDSLGSLGNHLDHEDGTLIVGAGCERYQGSSYVFERIEDGSYQRVAMLASVKEPISSGFGARVAVISDDLFVTSLLSPIGEHGAAGRVHHFRLPQEDAAETPVGASQANQDT